MKGANIDTLTDNPADIIKQLNELSAVGCNLIRWQLVGDPKAMANWTVEQYRQWLANRLWVLDQCVPTLLANYQPIILVFHHPIGGMIGKTWQLFHKPDLIAEHYRMLDETVARYKNNDAVFAIEPINEPFPKSNAQLQAFYTQCGIIVRSQTHKHIVVGHKTSDCDNMEHLKPIPIDNVWYTYHFYKPSAVLQKNGERFNPTKTKVKKWLRHPLAFANKHATHLVATNSRMLCGEFGCFATSGKGKNQEPWIRVVAEVLNEIGHDWCWHTHSYYDPTFKITNEQFWRLWR